VVRGRFGERPFSLFNLERGRLRAALGIDDGRTISRARRLLESRLELPAEALRSALADPGMDLRALAQPR
jgi:hypothetical protein